MEPKDVVVGEEYQWDGTDGGIPLEDVPRKAKVIGTELDDDGETVFALEDPNDPLPWIVNAAALSEITT